MKSYVKKFFILLLLFLVFFFINLISYAQTISQDLENTFFRLHIIANSDSEEDQNLKLLVRDEIISYLTEITDNSMSKEDYTNILIQNKANICKHAEKIIKENNYNYPVDIEIGNFYFPTKYYGNISLPAGNYDGIKLKIGNASGQNWWCSLFPPLCFINVSSGIIDEQGDQYLMQNLSSEEYSLITTKDSNINFKFKIIELLNNTKK